MSMDNRAVEAVAELVKHVEILTQAADVVVVGVCGFPGAGKTTLCQHIAEMSGVEVVRLDCDLFSTESYSQRQANLAEALKSGSQERIEDAENTQNWYAYDEIARAITDLKSHRRCTYDRAWNRNTGELDERYHLEASLAGPVIVLCDCIYLLHPPIRDALDCAIFVDAPEAVRFARGRVRSRGDANLAERMERISVRYTAPYFTRYADQATIVFRTGDVLSKLQETA
ncbi:AAA family ATPase [Pseudorhizobium pelagicum]|uniref:AAA+ ATPase domain-containing protein n=1 Tax=Pseudorhizobium pelagicum TaxID=1509405 RepID=A0A922P1D3_9HYPH|nr:AAA family ATPase [Pseudorhizobium pelagicum]KEQ08966.1 hypothetical protein GV67_10700 [Pseudorhizobium pelagicum]KEQ09957.1 hypothetical protein GV68_21720 [Pseudorhizobium pelagicum]